MRRRSTLCLTALALSLAAPAAAQEDDRDAYRHIVERVHAGEGYYQATATELRAGNFPLKPALAFRMPTLAIAEAALPSTLARAIVLWVLAAAALIAFAQSFADRTQIERLSLAVLAMSGLANVGAPGSVYLHEAWSIVFIVAGIAARRRTAVAAPMLFCAAMLRETAAVALIAFALDAALSRRRWRAGAFVTALGLFGALWLVHARFAAGAALPGDPSSPGWVAFGGVPMIVSTFRWNIILAVLPLWLATPLFAISLWGLARDVTLRPAAIYLGLFLVCLLVFGRPDNSYWGIMIAPVTLLGIPGLAKAPRHRMIARNRRATLAATDADGTATEEAVGGEPLSTPAAP